MASFSISNLFRMNPKILFMFLAISAGSAVVLNTILVFVVLRYSTSSIGVYKWFLVAFAVFEALYAVVVFASLPVHLIADNSWIVFSHGSLLENTFLSFWGPGLYCAFYELWIGFVVVMFVYRYIVVCLENLKRKIRHSTGLKIFVFLLYLTHFIYSVLCGMYWCTRNSPSEVMKNTVREQFTVDDFDKLGYMLMGFKNGDGSFSPAGSISVINHYILVAFSAIIICFCCFSIWRTLSRHTKQLSQLKEMHIHKQIFLTLVLQTIVPLLLCHLPTLIFLTYPLWPAESKFGSATSILSVMTTIPKVLDPIVTVICIHDYRRGVLNICKGNFARPASSIQRHTSGTYA